MRRSLCLLIIVFALVNGIAQAQEYPVREDPYVNDYANLLSPADEASLRELVKQVSPDFDLTILTIMSTDLYDPSLPSMETFATHIFNRWGIGDAEDSRGVLILIVLAEQGVHIELGSGYGSEYDAAMEAVIDESMSPRLGQGDIAGGLSDGVRHLYREIMGYDLPNARSFVEILFTAVLDGFRQTVAATE